MLAPSCPPRHMAFETSKLFRQACVRTPAWMKAPTHTRAYTHGALSNRLVTSGHPVQLAQRTSPVCTRVRPMSTWALDKILISILVFVVAVHVVANTRPTTTTTTILTLVGAARNPEGTACAWFADFAFRVRKSARSTNPRRAIWIGRAGKRTGCSNTSSCNTISDSVLHTQGCTFCSHIIISSETWADGYRTQ